MPVQRPSLHSRPIRAISSAGLEHYLDKVGVTGSNPVSPTKVPVLSRDFFFPMNRVPLVLSIAAVIGVVVLFYRYSTIKPATGPVTSAPAHVEEEEEHEELEVAVIMGRIQRFHQKWWLAGKEGNTELAKFYLHELDEAMEEIADAHVTDDGVDVSAAMRTYGIKTIDQIATTLDKEGVSVMHGQAELMANMCTSCHVATDHGYIRIKQPDAASFPDQDFSLAK